MCLITDVSSSSYYHYTKKLFPAFCENACDEHTSMPFTSRNLQASMLKWETSFCLFDGSLFAKLSSMNGVFLVNFIIFCFFNEITSDSIGFFTRKRSSICYHIRIKCIPITYCRRHITHILYQGQAWYPFHANRTCSRIRRNTDFWTAKILFTSAIHVFPMINEMFVGVTQFFPNGACMKLTHCQSIHNISLFSNTREIHVNSFELQLEYFLAFQMLLHFHCFR